MYESLVKLFQIINRAETGRLLYTFTNVLVLDTFTDSAGPSDMPTLCHTQIFHHASSQSLKRKPWLLYKLCSPFSPNSLSVTGTTKCHKVLIRRQSQQNGLQRGNELRKSEKRRSQWLQVEGASRDIGGEWCKRGDSRRG
jgi:hypothetical protein